MSKINISLANVNRYFYLQPLSENTELQGLNCSVVEYSDYLTKDAMRSMKDHIAKTWLLYELKTDKIVAYMSLIMDAIE